MMDGEPPKDGKTYIATEIRTFPVRWRPYKATSNEAKRGKLGRWQVMNEYTGWGNYSGTFSSHQNEADAMLAERAKVAS